jgi:hypothetical protein
MDIKVGLFGRVKAHAHDEDHCTAAYGLEKIVARVLVCGISVV